jgi:hypothetical protein
MEAARFDALVRRLDSRRGALRTAAGLAGGLALTVGHVAAAPCVPNGAKCDPAAPQTCCTDTCKKRKGKFKCAPAGAAFGCTKKLDFCRGVLDTPCPHNPAGESCVVGKGKPICSTGAFCRKCAKDADCTTEFGPTARCVTGCAVCKQLPGAFTSVCAVPAPPPV